MASELTAADVTHRLADQLQVLSQVAETLTFRLLDLEERLAGQELQLQGGAAGADLIAEGTELRLAETEERLTRLEALLESGLAAETDGAVAERAPAEWVEPVRHLRSVEPDLEVTASVVGDLGAGESEAGESEGLDSMELDSMDSDPIEPDLIHPLPIHAEQAQEVATDDFSFRDEPFLEEHEQPFMDELSA